MRSLSRLTLSRLALSRRARLMAFFIATTVAATTSITYAVASEASPASTPECFGVKEAMFPPNGFVTDPGRDQGGHMWTQALPDGSTCIGTVVEYMEYAITGTKTWTVIAYSPAHPSGEIIASNTFTLNQGFYLFPFRIRKPFAGLTKVCVSGTEAFGISCVSLLSPPGSFQGAGASIGLVQGV
jgi:hypothetical protein